jgi:uncharacterized protein YjiS (DUF1127 family)
MLEIKRTALPHETFCPLTPEELQQTIHNARAAQAQALRLLSRRLSHRLRGVLRPCTSIVRHWLQAANEWRRIRRARAEMSSLSDATLKDIGVCRSEIPWLAQHGRSDLGPSAIALARLRQRFSRRSAAERSVDPTLPPPDKHAA